MTGVNLIYIYDVERQSPDPPPDDSITTEHLLLPPILINRLPWSRGYFETVAHRALNPRQLLPRHCFKDSNGRYFDEHSNKVDEPTEPVGVWGLGSFRTVDDAVSAALGIPLAPD
jgi:hypothetical protein